LKPTSQHVELAKRLQAFIVVWKRASPPALNLRESEIAEEHQYKNEILSNITTNSTNGSKGGSTQVSSVFSCNLFELKLVSPALASFVLYCKIDAMSMIPLMMGKVQILWLVFS
jgi:hypothetical protein